MKSFDIKTMIHFGEGSLGRLKEIPYKKVLVITDPFVVSSGMIELITEPLNDGGIQFDIFKDVVPDPPIEKISQGVKKMLEYKPEAGRKYPLVSREMTPDEAILDAELVKSVPPSITADTGLDVFTHALEACVSSNKNDFATALAEKAIEICGVFLLRAYLNGSDTHARQKMHVASCLAGLAFNSASLGLNHGMAHQLGAMFHIPHGRANAMLLPHIIEFNSDINKHSKSRESYLPSVKRYANIAQILGLSSYNKIMTVRSLVNWVQFMLKEMDVPLSISQMGTITHQEYISKLEHMTEAALKDGCTTTNPRQATKADIIRIYEELW